MVKPIEVKPLENYRLWLKFSDGVEGTVDLSDYVGDGVFTLWNDYANFEGARIGSGGEIVWNDDIDLDSDTLHMQITGKTSQELFPRLRVIQAHA